MAINIALAGNPNCGKTTMFNDLTGANQYVGNWPGVTVEKKEGKYRGDKEVVITDLPGVYSLSPYTPEEIVTRDYLMSGKPDVVVNLVDATNLERNLYLTTQIIDLGIPVVLALNMMDLVEKNGDSINVAELSRHLGCPVVETSALKGRGMDALMERAIAEAKKGTAPTTEFGFGQKVEEALAKVIDIAGARISGRHARWYAIKLLEGEQLTIDKLNLPAGELSKIAAVREALEDAEDDDAESIITNERYDAIGDVCAECVKKSPKAMTTTQKIDRVVTNRILGIPIFIVIMFLVYYISVSTVGTLVTDWANDGLFGDGWLYTNTEAYDAAVEEFEGVLETAEGAAAFEAGEIEEPDPADYGLYHAGVPVVVGGWLEAAGAAPWVQSLVLDGIIAGVGAVIGFIPQLIVLFILLGFLEGCGYMARVAFIMDRIFRRFGLSGKSFIPMLIASGCGVPAVMATKTIENEKDRRMTIMTTTMIPCGAKLPIIALVFGALAGGDYEATWWVAPLFYFLGLAAIILSCIILKKFRAFAGEVAPFIMELPQYHLPTVKNV
ncbi:ferrous iron transporter B, partial [Adlercreutzia caecimuris]|uniref:ferrous iron transporter B n=1 Tax=Adlercreutzia caecimuris TaxID=671266 RepID=UPI002494153C